MNLLDVYDEAMRTFGRMVLQVRADQWDAPTPCTEWSVRNLVNHLVREQLWAPHLLAGRTLDEVGDRYDGDVLGVDPLDAWQCSSAAAHAAWMKPDATSLTVHLSFGDTPSADYCWQMACDLVVHAWDLAGGIGAGQPISEDIAETLLNVLAPRLRSKQNTEILGVGVPVPNDAPATERLLGITGRNPES